MSRERTGYSLKRERGLVPHLYTHGQAYAAGAWRWWPSGADDRLRAKLAHQDTPVRDTRFHCFPHNYPQVSVSTKVERPGYVQTQYRVKG